MESILYLTGSFCISSTYWSKQCFSIINGNFADKNAAKRKCSLGTDDRRDYQRHIRHLAKIDRTSTTHLIKTQ